MMKGNVINRFPVSRRWLLAGAAVATTHSYLAAAAGKFYSNLTGDEGEGATPAASAARSTGGEQPISKPGQIGFNVQADTAQLGATLLFLDRMKSCGNNGLWTQNGPTYGPAPVSQYGYPTGAAGAGDIYTFVGLRAPVQGTVRYVLRHNGAGLKWRWNFVNNIAIVDASDANRVIFDVSPAISGQGPPALFLSGASTWPDYRPGGSATAADPRLHQDGIAVVELALEADYLAGKLFHPTAVQTYGRHFALRFMDVMKTNAVVARNNADRTSLGYCSYSANTTWGMPLEAMVALCNEAKANLWYCLPHAATDAYQDWAFSYIRDKLDPSLYLQLEYSNEVWNQDFRNQYNFAQAQGQALNRSWGSNHGYGYLAAKMVNKARQVFGTSSKRVLGMFARQTSADFSFTQAAQGVGALEGKKTRDYFAAVACGFYTGGGVQDLILPTSSAQQKRYVLDEVSRYEATGNTFASRVVRQELVQQVFQGNAVPGWGAGIDTLDRVAGYVQQAADFARAEGIAHLVGYEGQNFHCNAYALGSVDGLRVVTMMNALANDQRISGIQAGSYMRQQYQMMRGKGMTGFMVFMDFGVLSQYGLWATKQDVFAADTPLWSFYQWYEANAPDPVLFELNMAGGGDQLTPGQATERVFTSFGGLLPAGKPVIKGGTVPSGMTFADGKLSGTPTAGGSYPLTIAVTDAGGREITASWTFTVAGGGAANWRYFRVTPTGIGGRWGMVPGDRYYRVGISEVVLKNGAAAIASAGWTATTRSTAANPVSRIFDSSTANSFITDEGRTVDGGQFTIDTGPGQGHRPTSIDFFQCTEAPQYSVDGCTIEVSRDGASWTMAANLPHTGMVYNGQIANVPLTYTG